MSAVLMNSMKMRVQRTTDLAGRILRHLATMRGRRTADEVAAATDSTPDMVRRLMMQLVAEGWVRSTRGRGGGYRLAVAPTDISLLELIEAFEGPVDDGVCVLASGPCGGETPCPMHEAWIEARTALLTQLSQIPVGVTTRGAAT